MHERYDRDERRLVATAAQDLWTDPLLDLTVDAAAPILDRAQWRSTRERTAALVGTVYGHPRACSGGAPYHPDRRANCPRRMGCGSVGRPSTVARGGWPRPRSDA